jgi:sugar transferase (PEP-CTERM system associated)
MFQIFNQYVSAKTVLLMVAESGVIALSLLCAVKLRFWNDPFEYSLYLSLPDFAVQSAVIVVVCLTCFYFNELYDLRKGYSPVERVLRLEQSLGAASLLLGCLYFLFPNLLLSRGVFLIGMVLVMAFMVLTRKLLDQIWQLTVPTQRTIILGTGHLALELARELTRRGDLTIKLDGFVSPPNVEPGDQDLFGFPVLGSVSDLEAITQQRNISRIIVALEDRRGALPTRQLVTLRVRGVSVEDATTALSALTGRISLGSVRPSWFVFSEGFRRSKWNEFLKRLLDLFVSLLGLVLASPVMILVAVAVRLDSKGPIFYRQTRVGRMSRCFEVLKFRSMCADSEQDGTARWAMENDPRLTWIGGFLRKYRLDELPQFINVIRGDMSFVGPRPERPYFIKELRELIPYYDERHSVRPGITGWAQVQYQYGSSIEDAAKKLEYDLFYLKHMSLSFDLAIIFQTIRIVIGGHGGR